MGWIEELERDMENLQRDVEDLNYEREGGNLSQALDEAKYKAIACKEDFMGRCFSSGYEYREEYRDRYW